MRIFISILCFYIFSLSGFAQMRANLAGEIDKILYYDVKVDYEKTPGFVIGLIVGDSTFVFSYGSSSKDSMTPPTAETLFEIGGLTKVFTASLIDQLVRDSLMHYDSSLNSYLPPQYHNPDCEHITIAHLLNHTSGLPKMPLEFGAAEKSLNNPYAHYTRENLLDFYSRFRNRDAFGKYYYSHVGYALLQLAIEKVAGQPYDSLLESRLLLPSGLNNTAVRLTDQQLPERAAGYAVSGIQVPYWTFRSFEASEGLKSTTEDLLTFLRLNMEDESGKFDELRRKAVPTGMSKNTYASYGWHIIRIKKFHDLFLHQGSTSGFRCSTGFVKETGMGVVILSNSEIGLNGLGYLILRMLNNNWKKRK